MPATSSPAGALPGPIVSPEWLAEHLEDVVVCDVRYFLHGPPGIGAYEQGHIKGAIYVDLDTDLSDPPEGTQGNHPLPSPERFAERLGGLGIGDTDQVVAYDASGGATAGRMVVMPRAIGGRAAILDGGLSTWKAPLETGPSPARPPFERRPVPWPSSLLVTSEEVASPKKDTVVLDVRDEARYHAPDEPGRPGGHIPAAKNLPWQELLDQRTGRFLKDDDLRAVFRARGIDKHSDVVASCGSGVSACAPLLLLEEAGFGPGRLFVPSFSGWSSDPTRPREQ